MKDDINDKENKQLFWVCLKQKFQNMNPSNKEGK